MNLSVEDQRYKRQEGLAGVLYNCSPSGFAEEVTPEEMNALSVYYLVGRRIEVDNIYEYREQILKTDAELVKLAENALRKVAAAFRVDDAEIGGMFSD